MGRELAPRAVSYTTRDVALYALGVGAAAQARLPSPPPPLHPPLFPSRSILRA